MADEAPNKAFTPRVLQALALARRASDRFNHNFVGTEHIFLGMLREGDSVAVRIMKDLKVDIERTRQGILSALNPNSATGAAPQAGA